MADEVENPALPLAGESSPTIRPIDDDEDGYTRHNKPGTDTADAEYIIDSRNPSPAQRPALPAPRTNVAARPPLKRDSSAQPPTQPPPAPPAQPAETSELTQDAPDSLTLADLKQFHSTFPQGRYQAPKKQLLDYSTVYDFEYADAQSLPVELDEWFTYSDDEEIRLRKCKVMFNQEWRASTIGGSHDWLDVTEDARRDFVTRHIEVVKRADATAANSLMMLMYIALGVWEETAGRQATCRLQDLFPKDSGKGGSRLYDYKRCGLQLQWILATVDTLHACGGLQVIYEAMQTQYESSLAASPMESLSRNEAQPRRGEESMQLWCCLTLMYLFVEVARTTNGAEGTALKRDILQLEPKLVNCLTQMVAKLRWDDVAPIPLTKVLLLAWKTILVTFGGIKEVEQVKISLKDDAEEEDAMGHPIITASPLDYHLFRQEISSKYPAYQPPPPLFPLEPESNSILPPLKHRQPSYAQTGSQSNGAPNVGTHSIMHQPVHIATPAPSPPPSPGGPGKAGKKHNYQTNQMVPFLYPPLDENSSKLGGKGSTRLQDALTGKTTTGADVPTSILEAAELFAKRMRATRAMKQLWEARVDFMKFERGWKASNEDTDADVDDFEVLPKPAPDETAAQGEPVPETPEQKRLREVGEYYKDSLPHLQSVVIVLLKAVLQNVTDLVTKNNGQNGGLQAGIHFTEANGLPNGSTKPLENGVSNAANGDAEENVEELDRLRTQEIAAKALTAILLLLLKWFKVSHVLQYEYMTQLLLDSNYVPLTLKLWQTQEISRACHYRLDKEENSFFYFCQANSRQGPPKIPEPIEGTMFEESEDESAPPPIKRTRDALGADSSCAIDENPLSPSAAPAELPTTHPPEIDELGYPITSLPSSPIRTYSWRNVFSSINYLRILQKVTRRKTHRALLLVSYKSSNHLKKTLKIPIHLLRYYTLKLFKSQVPFCGRKWRQGNMKIITAVWLSVPAELRDDWLSGGGGGMGGQCVGDVDGTVEDALPLEQSLRALTHWWNVRNFPEVMGVGRHGASGLLEAEMDFFERELERMSVRSEAVDVGEEMAAEEADALAAVSAEGWQGPIEGY